jgi:dihydroorotase
MGSSRASKSGSSQSKTANTTVSAREGIRYELLLKGGEFIDPASGRRGRLDVAFSEKKVAEIAPDIDSSLARQVESAAGLMVVPGLIDCHVHVAEGIGVSVRPDVIGVNRGATTLADAGSCGSCNFGAFKPVIAENRTRVFAWLNISTIGQTDLRLGELILGAAVNIEEAVEVAVNNPEIIVGFKARLSSYVTGNAPSIPYLQRLLEAGNAAKLPVMIHVGDTVEPLGRILDMLRPGDVCSHYLTSRRHNILGIMGFPGAAIIPEAFEARKRGVFLDVARGRNHLGFLQLQKAIEAGLLPDMLSTDLTLPSSADPGYSLMMLVTQFMAFGVAFEDCLKQITVNPAKAIGRPQLGKLEAGGVGDATLLNIEEGDFTIRDVDGQTRKTDRRVVAAGVVRDGSFIKVNA